MTGFGYGNYYDEEVDFNIEIKTINHRYRDYSLKIPKVLNSVEDKIKNTISQKIARGRIECSIKYHDIGAKKRRVVCDHDLAQHYISLLKEIKELDSSISPKIDLTLIAEFPDVIRREEETRANDLIWVKIEAELNKVLDNVNDSRLKEGENLKKDILLRNDKIKMWIDIISKRAPKVLIKYQTDLKDKIKSYTEASDIDQGRLLTEIAIMADKLNIDEELTRLVSHTKRLEKILEEVNPIGRKLDFLIQEINREINTIGSKANDLAISSVVVDIKSEIEKIREQIQNIE